jgi:hypothetical protein
MQNTETTMTESSVSEAVAALKNIPTREVLIETLTKQVMEVTFLKLDGDKRVMTCTKSFDVIPLEHQPKTNKEPKEGTITVWDINAQAWRSFRYDRVQEVKNAD